MDRLDVHLGKCAILIRSENYSLAKDSIIVLLKTSIANKNKWFWTDNKPIESIGQNGMQVVLESVNDYLNRMFQNYKSNKYFIKEISEIFISLYPNVTYGYNYLARYHMENKDYNNALDMLLKAYVYNPDDYVIVGNIAYIYKSIGDKDNALKYYTILSKMKNNEARKIGFDGIEGLK
ncbi:MAG TPA: hypothetical protein PK746_01105 [Spirochaetales bacterium]|nr:hypothetical protein [Spirochaetales bacterium]